MQHRFSARALDAGCRTAQRLYVRIAVLLGVAYFGSGITLVEPGEVAVVRRFGRWIRFEGKIAVNLPGPLLAWPQPIDEVVRLPVKQEQIVEIDEFWDDTFRPVEASTAVDPADGDANPILPVQCALTGDQNVIHLKGLARYRISSPDSYLTASQDPRRAMRKIVISAITTTLSTWAVDDVLRLQSATKPLAGAVQEAALRQLARMDLGVELTAVEFGEVAPPAAIRREFLAVHEARVDQETWREEASMERAERLLSAETLARQFVADARGKAFSRGGNASRDVALFESALAANDGPLGDGARLRLRQDAWRELARQAKGVWYVPVSAFHGTLRLPLPDPERSR